MDTCSYQDLSAGNVILIISSNTPQGLWPLVRVTLVYSQDNMEIQNRESSSLEEPIDKTYFKLCHLELILKKKRS